MWYYNSILMSWHILIKFWLCFWHIFLITTFYAARTLFWKSFFFFVLTVALIPSVKYKMHKTCIIVDISIMTKSMLIYLLYSKWPHRYCIIVQCTICQIFCNCYNIDMYKWKNKENQPGLIPRTGGFSRPSAYRPYPADEKQWALMYLKSKHINKRRS